MGKCSRDYRHELNYIPLVIRYGVAGWDYKDWWGPVYPANHPKGFDPLNYLSQFYDTVEINSTFYGAGSAKASQTWVRRVAGNPQFKFTAKLWKRFTHDRDEPWSTASPLETCPKGACCPGCRSRGT